MLINKILNIYNGTAKKSKENKKQARLLDEKNSKLTRKFMLEYSDIKTPDEIIKFQKIVEQLIEEEELETRLELELRLEALKYVLIIWVV